MTAEKRADQSAEIAAIGLVHKALKGLDMPGQKRVVRYVLEMLGHDRGEAVGEQASPAEDRGSIGEATLGPSDAPVEEVDGISAVAVKWMKRNNLDHAGLEKVYSLGVGEIDLVAKEVPGKGTKERMKNVVLLKGVAAFLGTGVPRITYDEIKVACIHYDAYDPTNAAKHLRAFSAIVTGSKQAGFTLTARGLSNATDLIKRVVTGEGG